MKNALLTLCVTLFLVSTVLASNQLREQQIAEQLRTSTTDGEPLWLGMQENRFLALHLQPSTKQSLGGVILLHGMGGNPDAANIIHPLRTELTEQGWETLSIQMPLAAKGADSNDYLALIPEAAPRIRAAIDFFTANQNQNLILIGHGLGASMGLAFLAGTPAPEIRALVAIGLSATDSLDSDPTLEAISKLQIPMLDLFGSRDRLAVVESANLRRKVAERYGLTGYRQDKVTGADHFFQGLDGSLQTRVGGWIRKVAAGMKTDGAGNAIPAPSTP